MTGDHPTFGFTGDPIRQRMPSPQDLAREGGERAASKRTALEVEAIEDAIAWCARHMGTFTSDDVWARLAGRVPFGKDLGHRLSAAARRGLIRWTGNVTTAARGGEHDHGQTLKVWAGGNT